MSGSGWFVGLDLGQQRDPTALAVGRRELVDAMGESFPPPASPEIAADPVPRRPMAPVGSWDVQHLQRFELRVPYPEVVERVAQLCARPELRGCVLAIDHTGPGRPVVDMFRRARRDPVHCRRCNGRGLIEGNGAVPPTCPACDGAGRLILHAKIRPVTITAGDGWRADGDGFKVSKRELASVLMVLMGARPQRLRVTTPSQHAKVLAQELTTFKVKVSRAGNEILEAWRESDHDDLVLATAIMCWVGERATQRLWMM